jgi:hypothetical protein
MGIIKFFKVTVIHGYIFIFIGILCITILTTLTIIHGGYIGAMTTDPNHPGIEKGDYNYMTEEAYEKYRVVTRTIQAIGFISALTGIILYQISKNKT